MMERRGEGGSAAVRLEVAGSSSVSLVSGCSVSVSVGQTTSPDQLRNCHLHTVIPVTRIL